jgi:hypothetical protein
MGPRLEKTVIECAEPRVLATIYASLLDMQMITDERTGSSSVENPACASSPSNVRSTLEAPNPGRADRLGSTSTSTSTTSRRRNVWCLRSARPAPQELPRPGTGCSATRRAIRSAWWIILRAPRTHASGMPNATSCDERAPAHAVV